MTSCLPAGKRFFAALSTGPRAWEIDTLPNNQLLFYNKAGSLLVEPALIIMCSKNLQMCYTISIRRESTTIL